MGYRWELSGFVTFWLAAALAGCGGGGPGAATASDAPPGREAAAAPPMTPEEIRTASVKADDYADPEAADVAQAEAQAAVPVSFAGIAPEDSREPIGEKLVQAGLADPSAAAVTGYDASRRTSGQSGDLTVPLREVFVRGNPPGWFQSNQA